MRETKTTDSKKAEKSLTELRTAIAKFVTRRRPNRAWYGTHFPLIPVPIPLEHPSLPNHVTMTTGHEVSSI